MTDGDGDWDGDRDRHRPPRREQDRATGRGNRISRRGRDRVGGQGDGRNGGDRRDDRDRRGTRQAGASARRVAFDVLEAVRESDAYANLLLPTRIDRARLSAEDAGFATELTYGTLRMLGYYDRVLALAAARPVERIDPPVLDVLRLGAHQILALATVDFAAVHESVELVRRVSDGSATGFVNGVLRTLTRSTPDEWRERVRESEPDATEALAAVTSHPAWIVRAFRRALEAEGRGDELADLLAADDAAPRVNYSALPGLATPPEGAEPDLASPVGFRAAADPRQVVTNSGGAIRVQDEGSQLSALVLSRARPIAGGEEWLDLCAGPGGKAALLGAEALAGGARLVANEVAPARLDLVERAVAPVVRAAGAAAAVELWNRDGRDIGASDPGRFDRILLDAPCSGLGALRRRPESRWRRTPRDVADLARLQEQLLDSAIAALKPGGLLAYVTCSPHLAETRAQVTEALRRHPRLTQLDTREALRSLALTPMDVAGDGRTVQLWPHRNGTDAMFLALLTVAEG